MKKFFTFISMILLSAVSTYATLQFIPGSNWKDTSGNFINAHGGQVIYADGYYYWLGETRATSVSCYRSTDLLNWTKLNNALSPAGTATDDNIDIASGRNIERPKVIYNKKTRKWVMWAHWENGIDYGSAKVCVSQADKVEGPYSLKGVFRPNEHDSRDQTIFCDSDGKAYHYCATDMNTNINVALLKDDYLTTEGTNTQIINGQRYEAPAIFKVGDMYFGLFSGCSGWDPNQGRYGYSFDPMNNWVYGRDFYANNSYGINFCVDDGKETTYNSQSTFVFQVHGIDKGYIYMGDRWNSSNVASSTYIWMPLSMRSGYPSVRYYSSWDLNVFKEMYRYKRAKTIQNSGEYLLLDKHSNRIISRPSSSFIISDDDTISNSRFVIYTTDDPYIFKIKESTTEKYLESVYGTMRLNAENEKTSQLWRFILQEDGYYKVQNCNDNSCLSVSGGTTQAGANIFLNEIDETIPQSFGVYYDSKKHPDYEEANIFSKNYWEINRELISEQNMHTGIKSATGNNNNHFYAFINADAINIHSEVDTKAELTVLCANSGQTVFRDNTTLTTGYNRITLSNHLSEGIYILKIKTPLFVETIKLMFAVR
jgi:hypothetical protein